MSPVIYPRNPSEDTVLSTWHEWRLFSLRRKAVFAWRGFRSVFRRLWRRGRTGPLLAVAVAPLAFVYVVATIVRDAIVYRADAPLRRHRAGRRGYLRHRYGGTQRVVRYREERVVQALLARVGAVATALDVPSGYGRFAPVLEAVSERLVFGDVDRSRLLGLRGSGRLHARPDVVALHVAGALPFFDDAFDLVFHLRYLHHVRSPAEREAVLAEIVRVSRRWVVLSYYRRPNLHSLVQAFQRATRGNRRRRVTMMDRRQFARAVRAAGLRPVRDRSVLPGVHAQRVVLLEKVQA